MSIDINSVFVLGRLVRDPEVRYTQSGLAIAKFSIANGYRVKQNNEWKDEVNYFDVVVLGNLASNCERFLKKGSQVAIQGELRQNRWQDASTNQTRSKIEILVNSIQFLSQPQGQNQSGQNYSQNTNQNNNQNIGQKQFKEQDNKALGNNNGKNFIPDPWGDQGNVNQYESFDKENFDSDDDIPF